MGIVRGRTARASASRRRRGISVRRHGGSGSTRKLLCLRHHGSFRLHQCVLYRADQIRGEDRPSIHRPSNRLLPCLQHLFHPSSGAVVDDSVGLHECLEEVSAEV